MTKNTLHKIIVSGLAMLTLLSVALPVHAQRTNEVWEEELGSYLKTIWDDGRDILINGLDHYLNFGNVSGETGYGFRDNAGQIQFKHSGGAWADIGTGGGGGATTTPGGADTQVQFNDGGVFGGDSSFVWNKALDRLGIGVTPTRGLHVEQADGFRLYDTTYDLGISSNRGGLNQISINDNTSDIFLYDGADGSVDINTLANGDINFTPAGTGDIYVNSGQILADSGTVSLPGVSFINSPDTGVVEDPYGQDGQIGLFANGSPVLWSRISPSQIVLSLNPAIPNSGKYEVTSDSDTFIEHSTDSWGINVGGVEALDITETGGSAHVTLPLDNDATTPTLAFGDGDTGIYESADDYIRFTSNGTQSLLIPPVGSNIFSYRGLDINIAGSLRYENPSQTNPTIVPWRGDLDTGLGWGVEDELALIAGGNESVRVGTATTTILTPLTIIGSTSTDQLKLPQENDPVTPTLEFADGDGIYQSADTVLSIATEGTNRWNFTQSQFNSGTGGTSWSIANNSSSLLSPTYRFDVNTGVIGSNDQVGLMAGGVQGLLVTETGSTISDFDINAASGALDLPNYDCSGNANGGALTVDASGNVVCSDDDGGAGGGSPGGSDSYIQYNNGGSFGGDADLLWDDINDIVKVGSTTATTQLLLPLSNDASTPTIGFGDGDSGYYEAADDFMRFAVGGNIALELRNFDGADGILGTQTPSPHIKNILTTGTAPGYTFRGDGNTGVGTNGADQLSLIAGGVEGARVEATQTTVSGDLFSSDTTFIVAPDNAVNTLRLGNHTGQTNKLSIFGDGTLSTDFTRLLNTNGNAVIDIVAPPAGKNAWSYFSDLSYGLKDNDADSFIIGSDINATTLAIGTPMLTFDTTNSAEQVIFGTDARVPNGWVIQSTSGDADLRINSGSLEFDSEGGTVFTANLDGLNLHDEPIFDANRLGLKERTSPGSATAGEGTIYADTADSKLKYINDSGTIYDLGGGEDTKCAYIESPTASDDIQSLWRNSTSRDYTLTELWAESDQTVTFMLQVDDGTPADIDTVDLAPAAGEAEDTSLNGDTTLAQNEELDLAITSVSGSPTWVSICWTYTW